MTNPVQSGDLGSFSQEAKIPTEQTDKPVVSGHAPGPWFEDEAGVVAEGWGVVASIGLPQSWWDNDGGPMTEADRATVYANTRLISAAPDLLGAAQTMLALVLLKYGNLDPDVNVATARAQAAIAKATGETQ